MTDDSAARWRESDSTAFLSAGALFVPQREAVLAMISGLLPAQQPCRVLGLGCAAGDPAAYLPAGHPNVELLAIDGSPTMIAAAPARLQPFGSRARLLQADRADNAWRTPRNLQATVSSPALHHLEHADKQQLLRDCRNMPADGGVLVLFDGVPHRHAALRRQAARNRDDAVAERSLHFVGDAAALQFFRVNGWSMYASARLDAMDRPASLLHLMHWLVEAGLHDVDLIRQTAGHALPVALR